MGGVVTYIIMPLKSINLLNFAYLKGNSVYNTKDEQENFIKEKLSKSWKYSIVYAILDFSTFCIAATFDWNDLDTGARYMHKLDKMNITNAVVNSSFEFKMLSGQPWFGSFKR